MPESKGISLQSIPDNEIHHIHSSEFTIGRGWLNCTDKRISRSHGQLKVHNENSVLLTSIHQNPLFYRLNSSDSMQVVNKDCNIALQIGDSFGLLPDLFWFKVMEILDDLDETPELDSFDNAIEADVPVTEVEPRQADNSVPNVNETELNVENGDANRACKRKLSDCASSNKKQRRSIDQVEIGELSTTKSPEAVEVEPQPNEGANDNETESEQHHNVVVANDAPAVEMEVPEAPSNVDDATEEAASDVKIKLEPVDEDAGEEVAPDVKIKLEPVNEDAMDATASTSSAVTDVRVKKEEENSNSQESETSTANPLRPTCPYGIRCYRFNPIHRAEEAHPGDADYRRPTYPDPPDGTPPCPFGTRCYRRNPVHFIHFSHPPSKVKRPTKKIKEEASSLANRPKRCPDETKTKLSFHNQLDDEDDTEDEPFGTDDSDQEYNPDNDSASQGEDDLSDAVNSDEIDTQDQSVHDSS